VKEIISFDGSLAALFIAEDEVNPLVQGRTYMLALERVTVLRYKVASVEGPRGEPNVAHPLAVLPDAEVKAVWRKEKGAVRGEELRR